MEITLVMYELLIFFILTIVLHIIVRKAIKEVKGPYYTVEELEILVYASNPFNWGDRADYPVPEKTRKKVFEIHNHYKRLLIVAQEGFNVKKLKGERSREEYLLKEYGSGVLNT